MSLKHAEPRPLTPDDMSVWTAATPPETIVDDDFPHHGDNDTPPEPSPQPLLVPWPDSTFIIRSITTGHVLTLLDGRVTLTAPGGRGSIHWQCVETKGWLGFRNTVSGRFLGHDDKGRLKCSAGKQLGWENFCVRVRPDGGCVLLMTHWERLWCVDVREDGGGTHLCKVGDGVEKGASWEFVKVE